MQNPVSLAPTGFHVPTRSVNLLELSDVITVMERLGSEIQSEADLKQKAATAARLFNEIAGQRGVVLKLWKKSKQ
jgi:hypothetical protein